MRTKKETDEVLCCLDWLRGVLRLGQWTILLHEETTEEDGDDGTMATMHVHEDRYVAVLRLSSRWREYPPEKKKYVLVHEMLHVAVSGLTHAMDRVNNSDLRSMAIAGEFEKFLRNQEELFVDSLATALTALLPDPWPGPQSTYGPDVKAVSTEAEA